MIPAVVKLPGFQPPWPLAVGQKGLFVPPFFPFPSSSSGLAQIPPPDCPWLPSFLLWMLGGAPVPAPRLLHCLSWRAKQELVVSCSAPGIGLPPSWTSSGLEGNQLMGIHQPRAPPPPGIAWVSQRNGTGACLGTQSGAQEVGVGCCPQAAW